MKAKDQHRLGSPEEHWQVSASLLSLHTKLPYLSQKCSKQSPFTEKITTKTLLESEVCNRFDLSRILCGCHMFLLH